MPKLRPFVENQTFRIVLFLFCLGILARLISFVILPEDSYSDTVFHFGLVKTMLETGSIASIQTILPMPLHHFLLVIFFGLTGFPIEMPFVRIIPFVVSFSQILFAYLLSKELFPEKKVLQVMAVAFTTAHVVLSIFSTVNFTGPIAATLMLSSFWLLAKLHNSSKINFSVKSSTLKIRTLPSKVAKPICSSSGDHFVMTTPLEICGNMSFAGSDRYSITWW